MNLQSARSRPRWLPLLLVAAFPALVIAFVRCAGPTPPTPSGTLLTPHLTPSPSSSATRLPTAPPVSVARPSPLLSAAAYIDSDLEVLFSGDRVAFTVGAWAGSPASDVPVSGATVDFGDGTTAARVRSCSAGSSLQKMTHVYEASGQYVARVTSAQLCEFGRGLDVDATRPLLVLPSAPPSTRAWPTCTTFQLHMIGIEMGAGLGNVGALFRLKNTSSAGCTLVGYPGIRLVSQTGAILPSDVHDAVDGDYLFPPIVPHLVALEPGGYAAFNLGYGDNPFGPGTNEPYDVACPAARWVRIVLPNTDQFGTASFAMAPCEGRMNVSAIFPGADWVSFQ
jgi:Protein of unknown function (DUF4232)